MKWTQKQIAALVALAQTGLASRDIAARLGRDEKAVVTKLYDLGVRRPRKPTYWTEEREDELRQPWTPDRTMQELATHFGKGPETVRQKGIRIGLDPTVLAAGRPRVARPSCSKCGIAEEFMPGCPRQGCAHYAAPEQAPPRTIAGVVGALA